MNEREPVRFGPSQYPSVPAGWRRFLVATALLLGSGLVACSAQRHADGLTPPHSPLSSRDGRPRLGWVQETARDSAALEGLKKLHQERGQAEPAEYLIGTGDILRITVFDLDELNRKVRVSGTGFITLPLLGEVEVARRSVAEAETDLAHRLAAAYMYDPQVNVFVEEYNSQQVAVIGAVAQPGVYNLTGGADTILDMIAKAGGLSAEAGTEINFIPAQPAEEGAAKKIIGTVHRLGLGNAHPLILRNTDPIVVNVKRLTPSHIFFTLPVRAGDVIMVPGGGDFLVDGWVAKPGSYKITPGLTVLGAVAAAGGALFPADTHAVKVIRGTDGEKKSFLEADLERIVHGHAEDLPLQDGDIVQVSSASAKLIPYGFYKFFTDVFRVGAGVSAAP